MDSIHHICFGYTSGCFSSRQKYEISQRQTVLDSFFRWLEGGEALFLFVDF